MIHALHAHICPTSSPSILAARGRCAGRARARFHCQTAKPRVHLVRPHGDPPPPLGADTRFPPPHPALLSSVASTLVTAGYMGPTAHEWLPRRPRNYYIQPGDMPGDGGPFRGGSAFSACFKCRNTETLIYDVPGTSVSQYRCRPSEESKPVKIQLRSCVGARA